MRSLRSHVLLVCVLGAIGSSSACAQDSTATPSDSARVQRSPKKESRLYYGGSVGLSIYRRLTQISIEPFVGYKLNRKLSIGARVGYGYFNDARVSPSVESQHVSGGIFSRYRALRQAYAQAELAFTRYDWSDQRGSDVVPFLLVGGGYVQPLAPKTSLTVDVMFDLLQDDGSPYKDWAPRVSTGINANF